MTVQTPYDAIESRYAAGTGSLIWTKLAADLETPVSALMKLGAGSPGSFLLESVEGGANRGRYSIIGLKPDLVWRSWGARSEVNRTALQDPEAFHPMDGAPLDALRTLLAETRLEVPHGLPPMAAGLFGYMGYDMVRQMERLAEPNPDPLGLPEAVFLRPSIIVIFDSVMDEMAIVAPVWPQAGVTARTAYDDACARVEAIVEDLDRPLPRAKDAAPAAGPVPDPQSNTPHKDYLAMVEKAKEYIRAGDIFQVVPSQRFKVPFPHEPLALYRALRRLNPSPYLFYFDLGDFAVVGSSPEILVKLQNDTVTIRPIAGTRPRGATRAEDEALKRDLLEDPKERAEHLMLLDLGRNDVGRVAEVGSVEVTDSFIIEEYSHVMHIVSNVEGRILKSEDALSALAAGFPAGTVSGAPKVRAMEIIDELEKEKRGVYAGAVGYFSADGSMDTCIALRTAVVKDGSMYVQAGGGVVADSDPEAEFQETVNKARALIRASQEAGRFASTAPNRANVKGFGVR